MSRSMMVRALLVVGGTLAVAVPATAAPADPPLVPFHAVADGPYNIVFTPTHRLINGTAEGTGAHIGRFTLVTAIAVNAEPVVVPDCPVLGNAEVFTATITAANGDTITLAGPGTGCPTSATTVSSRDDVRVTGGTGRFAGATGQITVRTAVDRAARTAVISFDGRLAAPSSSS